MPSTLAKTNETIIFLHIPKTAGTTLDQIIYRQYRYGDVYETGKISQQGVEDYKNMSQEERRKYRFLKGHMAFGIHEYAPGPYAYFTFLREPIDRTISHLYFIHRHKDHPAYELFQGQELKIQDFLELQLDRMLFNAQTRILSGAWDTVPIGGCTEEHLELAKENLKNHIRVIGITERFDESLLMLGKAFGWRHLFYKRLNITKKRPQEADLDPELLTAVKEANRLDIALYKYGSALFEEQILSLAPNIDSEVNSYKIKNRYTQPLSAIFWEMRKLPVRTFIKAQLERFKN